MTKKTTLRDVAREAGVSVATVSYIMNNRTDQKISDATRKKVLQIANLLDYTPNSTAKSLATGRSNLIGIAYRLSAHTPSRNLDISAFVDILMTRFHPLGYDILMIPVPAAENGVHFHHNVDAVIAIDLPHEDFVRLADSVFVPVISVDMRIDDKLFYQIVTDFPRLIAQARNHISEDICLVMDRYYNENFLRFITDTVSPPCIFYTETLTSSVLQCLRKKKVIALGHYTGQLLHTYMDPENLTVISPEFQLSGPLPGVDRVIYSISQKADAAVDIVQNALNKKFDLPHDVRI